MEKPRIGVAVVLIKNEKVLLGLRKSASHGKNTWSTAGGHLEFGESIEKCAARELLEETGLKAKNFQFAGVTNDIFKSEKKHYITIFVYCEYMSGKLQVMEQEKCQRWEWFSWENLPSPLFLPVANLIKQGYTPYRQSANMKTSHMVYLSGSIPKTKKSRDEYQDWREDFMKEAKKQKLKIVGVNPNKFSYDLMPVKYFYGRDVHQIYLSDFVVVNATEKIGIGTAQELLIAHYYKKPVIAISPFPSHYRKIIETQKTKKLKYTHPFLLSSASLIVSNYKEAVKALFSHYRGKSKLAIKTIDNIETERRKYTNEALKYDEYTRALTNTKDTS